MLQRSATSKAALTLEMHTSENPGLASDGFTDPILFATALKKNRFYLFTKFEPEWTKSDDVNSSGEWNEIDEITEVPIVRDGIQRLFERKFILSTPGRSRRFQREAVQGRISLGHRRFLLRPRRCFGHHSHHHGRHSGGIELIIYLSLCVSTLSHVYGNKVNRLKSHALSELNYYFSKHHQN